VGSALACFAITGEWGKSPIPLGNLGKKAAGQFGWGRKILSK
jgi:hypothetical protein